MRLSRGLFPFPYLLYAILSARITLRLPYHGRVLIPYRNRVLAPYRIRVYIPFHGRVILT